MYELVRKGTIFITDDGAPLLARLPTPQPGATSAATTGRHACQLDDEPTRIRDHF